jgi:acyl dehydratase
MLIPIEAIGRELPSADVTIERGRVRFFAEVIGEIDPVYSDLEVAQAAGHPDLPVPPTFLFSLELDVSDPFVMLTEFGVDLRQVLHGEQSFTYHLPVHAGETLTVQPRIVDVYSKKAGALEFLVKQTNLSRLDGTLVAELSSTLVVRNPEAAR